MFKPKTLPAQKDHDKSSDSELTIHRIFVKKLKEGNFYPALDSGSFGKRSEIMKKLASVDAKVLTLFSTCRSKKAEGEGEMEKEHGYERMRTPGLNIRHVVNFGRGFSNRIYC